MFNKIENENKGKQRDKKFRFRARKKISVKQNSIKEISLAFIRGSTKE